MYRGRIKVKDEPEDVFEKIKGTELVMFVHMIFNFLAAMSSSRSDVVTPFIRSFGCHAFFLFLTNEPMKLYKPINQ